MMYMALECPNIIHLIPEFRFTTSRSGGPGGQHVNKVNTKVTLRWDVMKAASISEEQRHLILIKLKKLINNDGEIVLSAHSSRSQSKNKQDTIDKLATQLIAAFKTSKPRKPTKPTKASINRRLDAKKRQAVKKKLRGGVD